MSISHLLAAFTAFFIGLINPLLATPTTSQQQHVLAAVTKAPTPITTITPTPTMYITRQVFAAVTTHAPLIDCIGPDGKHLKLTEQACDAFNNAWHHTNPQTTASPYGQATKIGDHTYELQLPPDDRMATPQEIYTALNTYRRSNGVGEVSWNDTLTSYAQSRANGYNANKALDAHAGFTNFINKQNGFTQLGFNHLGENAAYAGPLSASHLIEWVFAADDEHNSNQLNNSWTSVGIGVSGIATDIVFASDPR